MGFLKQEYWGVLPFSSLAVLPNPEIELGSPTLQADSLLSEPPGKPYWAPKSLQRVIAAMKLKDAYSLEGKL